jgi:hypothetical protein
VPGEDKPKLGLAMTGPMSGTADPYWQRLSDLVVQGSVASQHAEELKEVFTLEANLDKWQGRVPSYLLSGVSHPDVSPLTPLSPCLSLCLVYPLFPGLAMLEPLSLLLSTASPSRLVSSSS